MPGHTGKVVSAAWSDEGSVAVTGDASGCVIEWNATTMKETHRRELGGRVAALAISKHGRVAAYVLGKRVRVLVWNIDEPTRNPQVIYAEQMELSGDASFACLDFSPAGDRIAGCAGDHAWLDHPDDLIGRVHVWEMIASP